MSEELRRELVALWVWDRDELTPHISGPATTEHVEALVSKLIRRMSEGTDSSYVLSGDRLKLISKFTLLVQRYRIPFVGLIWGAVRDLVEDVMPDAARKIGYEMMHAAVQGQFETLGMLRFELLRVIQTCQKNLRERQLALVYLTKNGRNITPFANEAGKMLVMWLKNDPPKEILELVINFVKHNFSWLDEEVIIGLCDCMCTRTTTDLAPFSLPFCDALVQHGAVPAQCVRSVVYALCSALNVASDGAWATMRAFLTGRSGHQAMDTLLDFLENPGKHNTGVLRGAVFFVAMSCWGSQRISSLNYPFSATLPYLKTVMSCRQGIVIYEVLLSTRRLLKKYGDRLRAEWDIVLEIVRESYPFVVSNRNSSLVGVVKDIFSSSEKLLSDGKFFGLRWQFVDISVVFKEYLSESSILILLDLVAEDVHPAKSDWLDKLE
eukprot:802506_1